MPDANPTSARIDTKTLGFINADGSGRQEHTFSFSGGSGGGRFFTQFASHPRWSMTGDELVFFIRDTAPNIRIIDSQGKMYGETCSSINGSNLTFDTNGYILFELREYDLLYEKYIQLTSPDNIIIAHYDLISCQIAFVVFLEVPNGYLFREINESPNGTLVMAYYDSTEKVEKILVYEPDTKEFFTFLGFHPSLNDNGDTLAYYSSEELLVIKDMRTGDERQIATIDAGHFSPIHNISMPGWSPDNKWLVYNTSEGEIYKVNIETNENIYLTYGWTPDWR